MYRSIAITGVACVAIGSAVAPNAAQAAIITNNFRVDATTGSLANQSFFGNFSYNDAALSDPNIPIDPSNGNQLINLSNGLLSLSFNFLGKTYTEQSDSAQPDFPKLNFNGGLFQGLDFFVEASPSVELPSSIFAFTIQNSVFAEFTDNLPANSLGNVTYGVQAVPTPALLPGLIGLGVGVLRKRKKVCA